MFSGKEDVGARVFPLGSHITMREHLVHEVHVPRMFAKHTMRVMDGLGKIGLVANATSVSKTLCALDLLSTLRSKKFGADSTIVLIVWIHDICSNTIHAKKKKMRNE